MIQAAAGDRAPLVAFLPQNGGRSQGAVEIATAPVGFGADFADTVFTAFFGRFGVGAASNNLNPIVVADPQTGSYANFINDRVLGNPSGLLATPGALFLADLSRAGIFFGSDPAGIPADQQGAIYRITPRQSSALVEAPRVENLLPTGASIHWVTDRDAITGLELWGGAIPVDAPRITTLVPAASGSGLSASVTLDGLDSATTYSFRVRVGSGQAEGSFRTAEGPRPPLLSTLRFGTTATDIGHGVATAPDGSIYAVGYSASTTLDGQTKTGSGPDLFLTRFDANGNKLWTRRWGRGLQDYGMNVVVAADGSVYVTGFTQKQVNGTPDYDALLSR